MIMTPEQLRDRVDYSPELGVFTWRPKPNTTRDNRRWNGRYSGTIAGNQNGRGYIRIYIFGRSWMAHRLAWLYIHGVWPDEDIDHKDRNRANNKIANLRQASRTQNNANTAAQRNNTSGIKGVGWHKRAKKWRADINIAGQRKYLGLFTGITEAEAAHRNAASKALGEFAYAESSG